MRGVYRGIRQLLAKQESLGKIQAAITLLRDEHMPEININNILDASAVKAKMPPFPRDLSGVLILCDGFFPFP